MSLWCPREANRAADALAKRAKGRVRGELYVREPFEARRWRHVVTTSDAAARSGTGEVGRSWLVVERTTGLVLAAGLEPRFVPPSAFSITAEELWAVTRAWQVVALAHGDGLESLRVLRSGADAMPREWVDRAQELVRQDLSC